ncbi:MAG TPA: PIN domain-containing protein [Verrucomicrobiae bacterium]
MGLILDSSLLIADERGKFDMPGFLRQFSSAQPIIAAITASELLHGVERAQDATRKARRQRHVEQILATIFVQPFDLAQARVHARIWAELQMRGEMIGPHDLLIAAAAMTRGHELATLNVQEFRRLNQLPVVDASPFQRP